MKKNLEGSSQVRLRPTAASKSFLAGLVVGAVLGGIFGFFWALNDVWNCGVREFRSGDLGCQITFKAIVGVVRRRFLENIESLVLALAALYLVVVMAKMLVGFVRGLVNRNL